MPFKFVFLSTDILLWVLMLTLLIMILRIRHSEPWRIAWRKIISRDLSVVSIMILCAFVSIALLDSVHIQKKSEMGEAISIFDVITEHLIYGTEKTYSEPFALYLFSKESVVRADGAMVRLYPRLEHAGISVHNNHERRVDIAWRLAKSLGDSVAIFICGLLLLSLALHYFTGKTFKVVFRHFLHPISYFSWSTLFSTLFILLFQQLRFGN